MRTLRRLLLTSVTCALAWPGLAAGQEWTGWSLYWENDSFVLPKSYSSDARYTNGVRFSLGSNGGDKGWSGWLFGLMADAGLLGEDPYKPRSSLVFGQNFFTPTVITTFDENPDDRPYAAFLYLGARTEITQELPKVKAGFRVRRQHSFEFDLGVIGPPALAKQTQKGVHLLRGSRIPKGWDHQLGTEPGLQASYLARASMGWHFFDLVPHVGVNLGTIQTFANAGMTARIGWQMSAFPNLLIPWTAETVDEPENWEVAALVAFDGRAFLRNEYVDGGLLGGDPQVDSDHIVHDWRVGLMARMNSWRFNYTFFIRRSPELEPQPEIGDGIHHYGSISIGRDLNLAKPGNGSSWWKRNWILEAGIGGGISHELREGQEDQTRDGMSMRIGLSRVVNDHLSLGAEMVGVLREGGPPDGVTGRHLETFMVNRVFTFGLRPFGEDRPLVLRGGAGWARVKVESTLDTDHQAIREDTGHGWLFGASYAFPLGSQASVGLDATWSHLGVEKSPERPAARFLSYTVGFKWHPGS